MGFWSPFSASGGVSNTNANQSTYGDNTPIVSQQAKDAYSTYINSLNTFGANPAEMAGVNAQSQMMKDGKPDAAAATANAGLGGIVGQYQGIATGATPQLGKGPTIAASTSADVGPIDAKTGAAYMDQYKDLYGDNVINPALAQFDQNAGKDFNTLRAGQAGAFGNKRAGVAQGNYLAQSGVNRGALAGNLLSTGALAAAGLGQTDATRALTADTTNAGNLLSNNQFNAGLTTGVNTANANIQNQRDITNLAAQQTDTSQKMQALAGAAGLTQEQANNVFTASGIDEQAAQALFASGAITQGQLETIMNAATQFNGSAFTRNSSSDSTTVDAKFKVG